MRSQSIDIGGPCAVCCVRADDPMPCVAGIHRRAVYEAPKRITFGERFEVFGFGDGTVFVLEFDVDSGMWVFGIYLDPGEDMSSDIVFVPEVLERLRAAIAEVRG